MHFPLSIATTARASFLAAAFVTIALGLTGCERKKRNRAESITQRLSESKTKTDDLRKAMRRLALISPSNTEILSKEVRIELNAWIKSTDASGLQYSPPKLLETFPAAELEPLGCVSPTETQFSTSDMDYLFESRMMQKLSHWVVDFPMRDSLLVPVVESKKQNLTPDEALQLDEAVKLFDWTIRNVVLNGEDSSSVEKLTRDLRFPINDNGVGYGYLPWQTLLFSRGDFIERGRVFTALARQRNITTCWVSVGAGPDAAGNIFAIGVLIGKELLLFEPKLGLPILDQDTNTFATLADVQSNARILKRLDLIGQFDYAMDAESIRAVQLLLDVPPVAASSRIKLLEQSLLGEERMQLFVDVDATKQRLIAAVPDAHAGLWWVPLLAQRQAASVQERLADTTPFSLNYMSMHGVWLLKTPASTGRMLHLNGDFEKTMDRNGALSTYMESRVDDETLRRLRDDPEVQRALGIPRRYEDTPEMFEQRLLQAQTLYRRAKVDAAFLLAQLHYDRGNYTDSEYFLTKFVIDVPSAQEWHAAAWYSLARAYQEQGKLDEAEAALTHLEKSLQLNPQEPGNRLRLRWLRKKSE
jgi:tetratricopeptide (TPR) repeat protein